MEGTVQRRVWNLTLLESCDAGVVMKNDTLLIIQTALKDLKQMYRSHALKIIGF